MRLDISARARDDIARALRTSHKTFGPQAVDRYTLLIDQALADLCAEPDRTGVRRHDSDRSDLRLYPLRHSRTRLAPADRVGQPRHLIAFRLSGDTLRVVRVLDERMDLPARLRG
ncbi:type II toxin-antitoxin system RelE/ParE family toxin [Brevundimonas balnearis]|uniref:Type II toxin-antitoxin system RelE/ParE family toxin n=1 Tax=Brevundimonas balnearis TaxID=1572858 RepID=A0ABV6R0N0_9CAUL